MKPIEQQIAAMTHEWPAFALAESGPRYAIWQGDLTPTARTYQVQIAFQTPVMGERFRIASRQPLVQVLAPALETHDDYQYGPLPHVYWRIPVPDWCKTSCAPPFLCLFSPSDQEWNLDDLISRTTPFWAARWLFFYEGWLATKTWHGGGRHPSSSRSGKELATV